MYYYLKNLSPTQQIGALFVIVFGLLLVASVTAFLLSVREYDDEVVAERRRLELRKLDSMIRSSWLMMMVFWVSWVTG